MGNWGSKEQNKLKPKNSVRNKDSVSQNSEQEQNEKKSQNAKTFQSLDEKHRRILNIAIASALKRLQSQEFIRAQQEEQKIISSLNRYYEQNKTRHSQVDAQNMTETDYEIILKALRSHHLFKQLFEMMSLERDFVTMLLASVKKKTFHSKQYIYKQFDPPTNFYVIAEGKLFIELNSMGLKQIIKGDYFGLESIIYDSEQGESVKVKSDNAILYEISKQQIIRVKQKINTKNKQEIHDLLQEKVIFFNFLDNKERENLLLHTVRSTYSKGEVIFEKDYDSNSFFVIKKGCVLIKIPQKKDLILQAGSSFGESSFYQKKGQRQGKAIAYQNNTVIYGIGSKTVFKSLGTKLDCAVLQNLQKWALLRDTTLNQLYFTYHFDMDRLLNKFKLKKCEKYQVLGRKGEKSDKVFINVRNEINFMKQVVVFNSCSVKKSLSQYLNYKFEQTKASLIHQQNDSMIRQKELVEQKEDEKYVSQDKFVYQEDIVVTERGSYAEASINQVLSLIIESIEQPQKHRKQQFKIDLSVRNIQKYAKLSSKNGISTILAVQKHFQIEIIVKIYHKKDNSNRFSPMADSVRTVDSKQRNFISSLQQNQFNQIYPYLQIISNLNHSSICGFYKAQEDQQSIYLILQYVKGVTLSQVHLELGIMPDVVIKYYILKIAFILDYLHRNNVIYRNITPQKVLIDNKGSPNFYDFKYAKRLCEIDSFRTSTIVGTPHYMPPEVIYKKPYSFQADFWQLGVVLYELIYQRLPFADDSDDPMQIFKEILQKQPKIKKQNSSTALKGLLQKNPHQRIKNFHQLTKQSFFQNFDWEKIENNKMMPPYVPKNKTKRFDNIEILIKKQKQSY